MSGFTTFSSLPPLSKKDFCPFSVFDGNQEKLKEMDPLVPGWEPYDLFLLGIIQRIQIAGEFGIGCPSTCMLLSPYSSPAKKDQRKKGKAGWPSP
jgi:hypothetical protein